MADTLETAFAESQAEASVEPTPVTESAPTEALGKPDAPVEAAAEHVEGEVEQPDAVTETPPKHQVKVRGQEIEVDYDELVNGYQRQADYTKSKQELADMRAQVESAATLWDNLREDPATTLAALQEHYAAILPQEDPYAEPVDPMEVRLQAIEAQNQQQQQAAVEAEITAEMDRLTEVHGDFIRDDLLEFAIEQEIPNLEAALVYQRQLQDRARAETDRLKAKQTAPPVTNRAVAAGSSTAPAPKVDSFEGALAATLAELGSPSLMDYLD